MLAEYRLQTPSVSEFAQLDTVLFPVELVGHIHGRLDSKASHLPMVPQPSCSGADRYSSLPANLAVLRFKSSLACRTARLRRCEEYTYRLAGSSKEATLRRFHSSGKKRSALPIVD